MINMKTQLFIVLYFILIKNIYADNTITCTKADDCKDKTKCISFDKENYCVLPCEKEKEKEQCGESSKCLEKGDIDGKNQFICDTKKECLTDEECAKTLPKSTCNLYSLKCVSADDSKIETETTTSSFNSTKKRTTKKVTITTKPPCVDRIPEGPHGCSLVENYCNDINYYQLLQDICPKTCGNCNGTGSGINKPSLKCDDYADSCPVKEYLCKLSTHKDLMKVICKKTCKIC